jgi:diguanylate cyclase (GGDEF)-like protein
VRVEDIACRYGGEEFLLIMPDASLESVHQRADQLRREVKDLQVGYKGQTVGTVSLSLGVAIYPEHGSTQESVLRAADEALYRAKQGGRDQVMMAEREG